MEDSILFSKLVDELVEFEESRQQLDPLAYGINTLTVFCSEEIIKNWIHVIFPTSVIYLCRWNMKLVLLIWMIFYQTKKDGRIAWEI